MDNLIELALEIQEILEKKGYKFYFIGGLAVQFWGQNRLTDDVDLNLITEFKNEEYIIKDLLATFLPRRADSFEIATNARVVLVKNKDNISIDIALGGFPFEIEAYNNSKIIELPNKKFLRVINPEDLIIMKAFAARPHDWEDVKTIIQSQGKETFNKNRIFNTVKMLSELKEEPEILDKLKQMFD